MLGFDLARRDGVDAHAAFGPFCRQRTELLHNNFDAAIDHVFHRGNLRIEIAGALPAGQFRRRFDHGRQPGQANL